MIIRNGLVHDAVNPAPYTADIRVEGGKIREIGPSLIRWPGGNFSGEYRWMDGLLPADGAVRFTDGRTQQ